MGQVSGCRDRLRGLAGVEEDGDGAVVGEVDAHVGAEFAGGDGDAAGAEVLGDGFVEGDGLFGARGGDERGAVAFACVAEEGELRDEEDGAPDVFEGQVELALGVIEDAELGDLLCDLRRVVFGVVVGDAQQHEKTVGDLADGFIVDFHGGFGDALDNGAHGAGRSPIENGECSRGAAGA